MKSFAVCCVICTLLLVVSAETEVDEIISADPKPGDLVDGDPDGDKLSNTLKDLGDWTNEDLTDQVEADSEKLAASELIAKRVKRQIGPVIRAAKKLLGKQLSKAQKSPVTVPKRVLPPGARGWDSNDNPIYPTHDKLLPNRKTAEDAARKAGYGNPPIHHPSPSKGNPHWHASKAGEKVPGSHYSYRRKG